MASDVHPCPIELRINSDERENYRKLCQLTNAELSQYEKALSAVTEGEQNIDLLRAVQELLIERSLIHQREVEDAELVRAVEVAMAKVRLAKAQEKEEERKHTAWVIFISLAVLCLPALLFWPFYSSTGATEIRKFLISPLFIFGSGTMLIVATSVAIGKLVGLFKHKDSVYLSFFKGEFPVWGNTNGSLCARAAFCNLIALMGVLALCASAIYTGWYRYFDIASAILWPFFLAALGVWSLVSLWIMATALLLEYSDTVPDSVFNWLCKTRPRYMRGCP